ncbi:hypothetical protein [Lentzea aerocolonigenes]|uniref:hypothetical protein n=1 Tax=Lentzea aerocolonigenes TaxID=68170 RepID=UPI0005ECCC6D|nr:hypothetical protein [Lentzea aerocolonigenes]
MKKFRTPLAVLLVAAATTACSVSPAPAPPPSSTPVPAPATSTSAVPDQQDPRRHAPLVRTHAESAGISPQLLMAILYNESYKPHDPKLERAWQKIDPDAAFGVANMHKAAFDEAKQNRDFAARDWQELPDDAGLAVAAAAWHLHDLAAQLPKQRTDAYTSDELLALGYNAGASTMLACARGGKPNPQAQSYVDKIRANWQKAAEAIQPG